MDWKKEPVEATGLKTHRLKVKEWRKDTPC